MCFFSAKITQSLLLRYLKICVAISFSCRDFVQCMIDFWYVMWIEEPTSSTTSSTLPHFSLMIRLHHSIFQEWRPIFEFIFFEEKVKLGKNDVVVFQCRICIWTEINRLVPTIVILYYMDILTRKGILWRFFITSIEKYKYDICIILHKNWKIYYPH